ncbi:GNAT family N-acetyltransferase [Caldalkalibacillus thermarum TA2.A1]|uniref:GNAT family N-acetyltransferase n=1 Tax=Caldalkalibacillus thermarum (strain TA2.A1) TaxID=986075 RepID=A0A8X8I9S5_CALTT|nr:GNAT family N-acetyltransferase [Caldalkalibacillus thermarum TA2.A1]
MRKQEPLRWSFSLPTNGHKRFSINGAHLLFIRFHFKGKPNEHGEVEIGYSIVKEYRNKGLTTEAVRELIYWGMGQPGVEKVLAACHHYNLPSVQVLRKVGMELIYSEQDLLFWEFTSFQK